MSKDYKLWDLKKCRISLQFATMASKIVRDEVSNELPLGQVGICWKTAIVSVSVFLHVSYTILIEAAN